MPTDTNKKFSFDNHVGKKLRNRRVQLKLTQTDIGKAINKSFAAFQRYWYSVCCCKNSWFCCFLINDYLKSCLGLIGSAPRHSKYA